MASLTDNIKEGLAKQGINESKIKETLKSSDFLGDLSNTANSMLKEAQGKLTSGANMLKTTLNDLTSSFPDAVSSFFGDMNTDASSLGDITSAIGDGAKEVNSKLKSIASSSGEAIAQAVSFTTKTVEDTISGVDTSSLGSDSVDMLNGLSDSVISNIEKATGSIIKESGDLSETIKSVSSEIAGAIRETPNVLNELKQSITEPITSTVNDFVGSLTDGLSGDNQLGKVLSDLGDAASAIGSVGSTVIQSGKEIGDAVIDILPSPVDSWVSKKVDSYVNTAASDLLGSNLNIAKYVMGKFSSAGSSDNILNMIIGLGDNSKYPSVADEAGGSLTALLGTGSGNQIDELYSIARSLCSSITTTSYVNFQYNKTLYDVLLQLAASMGMTDLVNQLKRCAAAVEGMSLRSSRAPEDNNPYWDERSVAILQNATNEVAHKGNVDMYRCIQENIGSSQMLNSEEEVKILVTNMSLKDSESGRKKNVYKQIISDLGYTTDSLVTTEVLKKQALKGADICAMSATDSYIIDDAIGAETRTLVQAAMYAYA